MKKIYLTLLCTLLAFSSWATVYNLGYCANEIRSGIGSGNSAGASILQGAIQLPATTMSKFRGDSITHISVGFYDGGPVSNNQFTIFIRSALQGSGTLLYSQRVRSVQLGAWNVIELDTPFKITGEEIFVGYLVTTSGNVMGVDSDKSADARGCWTKENSEDWVIVQSFGNLSIRAMVSSGEDMYEDVTMNNVTAPKFTRPGAEFGVSCELINNGLLTISQLEVACWDKDVVIHRDTIRDIELFYGQKTNFMIEGLHLQEIGKHELAIEVVSVNGGKSDVMPADNKASTVIDITENCAERMMLLDHFTTEACPKCPQGGAFMKQVVEGYENRVAWIAHHAGFYTDGFTLQESEALTIFYNSATTYAPAFMFDRVNFESMGAQGGNGGPIMSTSGQTVESMKKMIQTRLNAYSPVKLEIDGTYDPQTRQLEFDVNYTKLQEIADESALLSVCLIQDGIKTFSQSGAPGEYTHNHVIRHFFDAALGVMFEAADAYTRHYSYTLPKDWNHDNLKMVAFASKYSQVDINGFEVYNAIIKPVSEIFASVSENKADLYQVKVIDRAILVEGDFDSYTVFDATGNIASTTGLQPGIYIVCVNNNGRITSHKCIIK